MRKMYWFPLGIALGLVILIGIVAFASAAQLGASANFASVSTNSANASGKVGSMLVTPEGVTISLVGTERHGTQMLFHLKLHNNQQQTIPVWNADTSHGFVFYNHVADTFEPGATVPSQTDVRTHPALGHTVAGQADSDGWIAFNLSSQYDTTLFYYYRVIHTKRCPAVSSPTASGPAPVDPSKCQPATLYSTLHWSF